MLAFVAMIFSFYEALKSKGLRHSENSAKSAVAVFL